MARLDLSIPYIVHKRISKCTQYDISHLTCNRNTQFKYQNMLNSKLCTPESIPPVGPAAKFESLLSIVKSTAVEIVGTCKPQQRVNYSNDSKVVERVEKRKLQL